jgi:hypothetical protein
VTAPTSPHDTDRYIKSDESGGGVSAVLRHALLARSGAQQNDVAARFFRCFADMAEDGPADALACMALLMTTAALGEDTQRAVDVVDAVLARYDAKPKVER